MKRIELVAWVTYKYTIQGTGAWNRGPEKKFTGITSVHMRRINKPKTLCGFVIPDDSEFIPINEVQRGVCIACYKIAQSQGYFSK